MFAESASFCARLLSGQLLLLDSDCSHTLQSLIWWRIQTFLGVLAMMVGRVDGGGGGDDDVDGYDDDDIRTR